MIFKNMDLLLVYTIIILIITYPLIITLYLTTIKYRIW